MITEDYVSFETAKLLKEKGFDEPCQYFYKFDSNEIYRGTVFTNTQIGDKFYNAPTIQMAMKYLREIYDISIEIASVWAEWFGYNYIARIVIKGKTECILKHYNKHEEACEVAIKYCLENLI